MICKKAITQVHLVFELDMVEVEVVVSGRRYKGYIDVEVERIVIWHVIDAG